MAAEDDDDYLLTESPLSGEFKRDGITVDVLIYRGQEDTIQILEVVDAANNSHVWDVQFLTDQSAMNEFLTSVKRAGMKQYSPYYRSDLHQRGRRFRPDRRNVRHRGNRRGSRWPGPERGV